MSHSNWSKKTGDDGARIKEDSIRIEWHISDVKEGHQGLTDDQCREVLHEVARNHNADIGVNWDVLDVTVNQLFSRQLDLLSGLTSYKSNPITLKQESNNDLHRNKCARSRGEDSIGV